MSQHTRNFCVAVSTFCCFTLSMELAKAQSGSEGTISASQAVANPEQKLDYVNAKPLPVPIASQFSDADALNALTSVKSTATTFSLKLPGSTVGNVGTGDKIVVGTEDLGKPAPQPPNPGAGGNMQVDFGTANLPFSTARADLMPNQTNEQYPYRASGKLFFKIGQQDYICSASLIKSGLVVTAAHCVANFGTKTYYSNWQFIPGYRDGAQPYGTWTAAQAFILTSYFDGSDPCQQKGVVCQDDVAILALNPQKDKNGKNFYPGQTTGWFAYGWDMNGFASQKITHITQLGYPACLDNGGLMERNDAQGAIDSAHSNNTVIGSLMCGGSSGGGWLINFGISPTLTGTTLGSAPNPNQVVGVTSWGSTDNTVKWMGASPFTSSNIVVLVTNACKAHPDACN